MKVINIIGNNANSGYITDGGRIKIRLFKTLLEREGFFVNIIELDGWKQHIFKIIRLIKVAISKKECIVIMAGPKGCRFINRIVYFLNRKHKSRVVFCPLGIGTLDYLIKDMTPEKAQLFLSSPNNDFGIKDKKMRNCLNGFDCVVVQNEILKEKYVNFYKIKKVFVLENFRDIELIPRDYYLHEEFRVIYLSRIKKNKGIFDLIDAVKYLNMTNNCDIRLDIYGELQLSEDEENYFKNCIDESITYKGTIGFDESIETIRKYDLFCLPTKYYGEGTSGALIEAMIAGTPPLVSNYSQAKNIVTDQETGFIFDFNSFEKLKEKLLFILSNRTLIEQCGKNAQNYAKKYTYSWNRKTFIELLTGDII